MSVYQQTKNSNAELWTSKLGKSYQKDQVDFAATAKELDNIRNQPLNKCCADCGTNGTVWSSVNLGVFTCMRCGSFHRALGTHISKTKGCTGTYLWSPDEVERMKEIGNERADKLYGSSLAMKSLPPPDASHNQWLEFFKDKYERRRWAGVESDTDKSDTKVIKQQKVITGDLLGLQQDTEIQHHTHQSIRQVSGNDFFSQFDL